MNKVFLLGEIADEPQLKETKSGAALAPFTIITRENFIGKDGNPKSIKNYHRCVAWGKIAEDVKGMKQGDIVVIEGSIQNRKWQKQDGSFSYMTEIRAMAVRPLDSLISDPEGVKSEGEPMPDENVPF